MRIDPDDRITVYVLGVALSSSMRSVDCRSGIINPFVVLGREQPSLSAYLTLPYLPEKMFYRLALRPPMGQMRIPELTTRLQNPQVLYSPGSTPIMEPFPSLQVRTPTWAHPLSLSFRENINFKPESTLVIMTYKPETREIQETHPPN